MEEKMITELGLKARAFNVLWRRRIHTINELCNMTSDMLLRMNGYGIDTVDHIVEKLAANGYRLLSYDSHKIINLEKRIRNKKRIIERLNNEIAQIENEIREIENN